MHRECEFVVVKGVCGCAGVEKYVGVHVENILMSVRALSRTTPESSLQASTNAPDSGAPPTATSTKTQGGGGQGSQPICQSVGVRAQVSPQ